jgi:hypothetical protein
MHIREEMIDRGMLYCPECTTEHKPIDQYCAKSLYFRVFIYTNPWNPAIRAYDSHGQGWLHTYQTQPGLSDREVSKHEISQKAMFRQVRLCGSRRNRE